MKECVSKAHIKLSPHSAQTKLSTADESQDDFRCTRVKQGALSAVDTLGPACCLVIVRFSAADAQTQEHSGGKKRDGNKLVSEQLFFCVCVTEVKLNCLSGWSRNPAAFWPLWLLQCVQGEINMIIKAVPTLKWCNIRSKNKRGKKKTTQHKPLLGQIPNIFCLDLSSTSKLNGETSSWIFVFFSKMLQMLSCWPQKVYNQSGIYRGAKVWSCKRHLCESSFINGSCFNNWHFNGQFDVYFSYD